MPNTQSLIRELKSSAKFRGTCPRCGSDFRLRDAYLSSVNGPPTAEVQAAADAWDERLATRKAEHARRLLNMTTRATNTSAAVNVGKIVEKIVPSFSAFGYTPADCRALFEPIDYVVFEGLARQQVVDALYFVDVKSGRARLTPQQQGIAQAIKRQNVVYRTMERAS